MYCIIYLSYKAKPQYKFYLNMQDIHIIFHYLFTSPPTNNHVIPLIFNLLMQAVHTISIKHNLISTYKKYRGIHILLFVDIPLIFNLLMQAIHTISTKHNLISTYKKYRGIHILLFILSFHRLII